MSKYITSVQLKNAEQADYERLDVEMKKRDFVKVIDAGGRVDESSRTYREYNYQAVNLQEVITAAYTAASRIGKQYSLTVMKAKRNVTA